MKDLENVFRVFYVDTETSIFGGLSSLLQDDFRVETFTSAQSCIDRLSEIKPDIFLVDVSLQDMSGLDFCAFLKSNIEKYDIPVIFMAAQDNIDIRMACYEAGGEDFIAKPLVASELLTKLRIAHRIVKEKRSLTDQAGYATKAAMSAMTSMGELGVVLQSLAQSFSCVSVKDLAQLILDALSQFELIGAVQFRNGDSEMTLGSDGMNVPLEASILKHMSLSGRIFQFKSRCVFNYGGLTILIKNMPQADIERSGRIRDNLALLAEGAEARLRSLHLECLEKERRGAMESSLWEIKEALNAVQANYRRNCFEVTQAMLEYQEELTRSFVHLGLSESQENELSLNAGKYMQRMVGKQDENLFIVGQLEKVAGKLEQSLVK